MPFGRPNGITSPGCGQLYLAARIRSPESGNVLCVVLEAGVLDAQAQRVLARYHRPVELDPHGRVGAEAIVDFDLAPLGERV